MEELDIVRLVNTLRNFEETQNVLFGERERTMLQLQRRQVISSFDDSS